MTVHVHVISKTPTDCQSASSCPKMFHIVWCSHWKVSTILKTISIFVQVKIPEMQGLCAFVLKGISRGHFLINTRL